MAPILKHVAAENITSIRLKAVVYNYSLSYLSNIYIFSSEPSIQGKYYFKQAYYDKPENNEH